MVALQGALGFHRFADDGADDDDTKETATTALSLHRPPSMCSEDWNRMYREPPPLPETQPGTPGGHTGGASSYVANPKPSHTIASSVPGVSYVSYDGSNGSMYPLPPVFGHAASPLLVFCMGN